MIRKFTSPFSQTLYNQLTAWVNEEQSKRRINLDIPMNTSMILDNDSSPEEIYILFQDQQIVAAAVVVDILKTRDFEIGLAGQESQSFRELVHTVLNDIKALSPSSITFVLDDQADLERNILMELGAYSGIKEAQLTATSLNATSSLSNIELLAYQLNHHDVYRAILMDSFGDDFEEAEAVLQLSLTQSSRSLYGIHLNNEIVGTINLIREEEAFITALAVHPKHQKKGIARAALIKAVEVLFSEGYPSVSLDVEIENTHALKLYEDVGFHIQHIFQFYEYEKTSP